MAQNNPYAGLPASTQASLRRAAFDAQQPYGSVAARFGPNSTGSIESRENPALFGQFGASNPLFQQSSAQYGAPAPRLPPVPQAADLHRPMFNPGLPMMDALQPFFNAAGRQPGAPNTEDDTNGL